MLVKKLIPVYCFNDAKSKVQPPIVGGIYQRIFYMANGKREGDKLLQKWPGH